jgi:6-phosphogluconolactonase (cycloisomerase 2 family)
MRRFRPALLALVIAFCSFAQLPTAGQTPAASTVAPDATLVYVGTYTTAKNTSKGIYLFQLDSKGSVDTLVPLGVAGETVNPSFLDIDPKRRLLFAVSEVNNFEGKTVGAVSAFSIDSATGKLTLINQQPSMGTGPCHLVLDKAGRHVLVANYGSGSVAVLPVAPDGRLGEASATVQHTGSSVNPDRQKGPHAHCLILDPANRFAFACDLGLDKVMIYRYDSEKGTLTAHEPAFATVKPGAGPRDMVFRPDSRFAYVGNEMQSTITAFSYDAKRGNPDGLDASLRLPGTEQHRGACRPPVRQVCVHLQPRAQFSRGLQRGCLEGDAHAPSASEHGWPHATALRDGSGSTLSHHGQPAIRQPARQSNRYDRAPGAVGRTRRSTHACVRGLSAAERAALEANERSERVGGPRRGEAPG